MDASYDEEEASNHPHDKSSSATQENAPAIISLLRNHRRQPIARNWSSGRKRFTAAIACLNTALLGIIVGIYAGMVPCIQYYLADERRQVIIGNAVLYFGLAISTLIAWPLPLLHGRKPYLLAALALALPLQFPQALIVSQRRSPNDARFKTGLLCARALTGLVLGFANVNYITVLLDLFGASLQSKNPHQEFVVPNDVRRHGGGMGMWLGIWSWCWIASLAVGFQIGAAVIERWSPDWGFYIVIIVLGAALVLNIFAPETRRAEYRTSVTEIFDRDENYITRRVLRGECKLHISTEGPKYWFEEVWAGMKLVGMMLAQPGFFVVALYLGWIYAQIVLVIILLGALLSRDYRWQPRWVGLGVMAIALGAFLAIPLTKAGLFSRERKSAWRTDSMTFQQQVSWTSHLVRRVLFTLTLPLMGLAYTISSAGAPKPSAVPIVFAGLLGFLSVLAIAECHGIIMETFDTSDLQPGVNTRHRLESMAVQDLRRRTNYTSFPRVCAGFFASQVVAFVLAGVATLVGGSMTRNMGAQASTGVTAGILLGLTILLTAVLWRWKEVQVIPYGTFGTRRDTAAWQEFKDLEKMGRGSDWKAVVIGNPSGKMRRMSVLELGKLSRWTEIRKLNFLIKGKRLGERGKRVPTFHEGGK
jgi:MFS family permease